MFDPSKMDLDLDNLNKEDLEKKAKIENKEDEVKKIISEEKTDILNEANIQKKEEIEEEEIQKEKNKSEDIIKIEEKEKTPEKIDILNTEKNKEEEKVIFDINIDSLEYLIKYLISKKYDFFTLEPTDNKVKVSFRTDNIEKEIKYIKYPTYSNILLKAKSLTKLKVENTESSQEWKTEINLNNRAYKILSKTVPSNSGEKLFFKVSELEKKQVKKKKEKMSVWKMMWIFAWLLFTSFVIWAVFMTIVLFNSSSVADLQFFNNLWIDTDAIKEFAGQLVNGIFGFIVLIEIILLFIFSYKALLTKKEFKQKRINRIIISIFFLILAATTLITWMFLAKKINSLKWLNYWKIEFYDNSKYLSKIFWEKDSIININENIIWPITIRFNNKEFIQKLKDEWFTPTKIIWEVWSEKIEKPVEDNEFIYKFNEKWLTSINLTVEWLNLKWEKGIKEHKIWNINLNNIINIEEIKLDNGWSKFIFDAQDLEYLWQIKWYYIPSLSWKTDNEVNTIISNSLKEEKYIWYKFSSKNIFENEEYYWLKIVSGSEEEKNILDKIFIVSKGDKSKVTWELEINQDIDNEKKYSFIFKNPDTKIWEAFIKEYHWRIQDFDDKWDEKFITLDKNANLSDLESSSKVYYTFMKSWEHKISLTVIDSNNKEHIFNETINVIKRLSLLTKLDFSVNNNTLIYKKDITYESKNNAYYIEDLAAPSKLDVSAIKIRSLNNKYWLLGVSWDLDSDWNFEKVWKIATFDINTDWIAKFKVKYQFINRNDNTEIIDIIETIHTTAISKEAILDLKIIKPYSYVPVTVVFDASSSIVTWKNIDKFIFDYWDGTPPEERDWKNTWHKYIDSWDYNIKLTVITIDWSKYSTEKKLILKEKPQSAEIKTSLKKAPEYQAIDFSAENSIWEVANYFWDFGDWNTSTQIAPSHFYKNKWTYKVKLTLEYTNKNVLSNEIEIEIYEN